MGLIYDRIEGWEVMVSTMCPSPHPLTKITESAPCKKHQDGNVQQSLLTTAIEYYFKMVRSYKISLQHISELLFFATDFCFAMPCGRN